ncbi:hypothetical protein D3C72_954120 [compost metagenome]
MSGDGEVWPATGGGHGYILTLLEEKGIQAVSWGGDNCRMTGITLNRWPTYLFGRGENLGQVMPKCFLTMCQRNQIDEI